jgi:hypothetical protein
MSKREKGDAPEMEGMLKKLKRAGDCFRGTPDGKDMASTEPASAVETPPEAGRPDETTPESAPPLGRRGSSPEGKTGGQEGVERSTSDTASAVAALSMLHATPAPFDPEEVRTVNMCRPMGREFFSGGSRKASML